MAVIESSMTADEYVALVNRYMDRGASDGWPIIPPSPDAVAAMIDACGRAPTQELGNYQLREKPVTVQDVAVQAVMAGCLPEFFPIVLATVEVLMPEAAYRAHSAGWVPWIIVNGPIRRQIGLNCGANLFGPGSRVNATIGRAFDLTLINLAGARTNLWDKSTQGSAYKYGFCIGEDEENSPWPGLHTTLGFDAQDSVVTAFSDSRHPRHVSHTMSNEPEHILGALAEELAGVQAWGVPAKPDDWRTATPPQGFGNGPNMQLRRAYVAVLSEDHRNALKNAGWTRRQAQEFLHTHAGRTAGVIRSAGISGWGSFRFGDPDDQWVALVRKPEGYLLVCAGGPGGHSMVGSATDSGSLKIASPRRRAKVPEIASPAAAHIAKVEDLIDSGRTDGLPVLPPTDAGVTELIAASGRHADEELGTFQHNNAVATVRGLAENAFMAGCLPQYMSALVAAFEMVIPSAHRYAGTEGYTPWVIFNGPVRDRLALNSSTNVFGPSIRVNAAIGRAIRLGLINIGNLRPGGLDKSAMSQMYKFTCGVIGENEDDSPWAPISTEFGFSPHDSTIMVLVAAHARQVSNHEAPSAEAELINLADSLASINNFDASYGPIGSLSAVVGLGSGARTHMKERGWSRRDAQQFMFERLSRKAGDVRRLGYDGNRLPSHLADGEPVTLARRPEDLLLMSTGMGGSHNMVCRILEPPNVRALSL